MAWTLFRLVLAERLQLAEPELVPIAPMVNDMVGDDGDSDFAIEEAHPAKRLGDELDVPFSLPASQAVPVAPVTLTGIEHDSCHGWVES